MGITPGRPVADYAQGLVVSETAASEISVDTMFRRHYIRTVDRRSGVCSV